MDNFVLLILLFSITSLISEKLDNLIEPQCYDNQNFQKKRCCTDFRTIGRKCKECVGSFGLECSKTCPEGYYGKKCSEKCQCKSCNSTSGECQNVTTEALNTATNMEESRLGMCELEDYDNIRESRMDFTLEEQTVDRISYARTYNKLSFNSRKSHAMAYKSNNLYNVFGNTASQTTNQSFGDYVIFASNHKSPNSSDSEHTQKRNSNQKFDNSHDHYADIYIGGSKAMSTGYEVTASEESAHVHKPLRGKEGRKKPKTAPKPVNIINTTGCSDGKPYSLANLE